jgi:putative FmdB family regulatory protein
MPIYAYRCAACGFRKDVLQKMSDPALTTCPTCGAESFAKQLSAPAFQLKGTGWYVTDFRDNGKKPDPDAVKTIPAGEPGVAANGSAEGGADRKAGEAKADAKRDGKSDGKSDAKSEGKSGDGAGTPAAAPPAAAAAKSSGSSGSSGSAGSSSSTGPASGGSSAG